MEIAYALFVNCVGWMKFSPVFSCSFWALFRKLENASRFLPRRLPDGHSEKHRPRAAGTIDL